MLIISINLIKKSPFSELRLEMLEEMEIAYFDHLQIKLMEAK
jgi:hypothetical protein